MNPNDCNDRNRCGRWKLCARCAAIRQKIIADKAETLESEVRETWYSVITPIENTALEIRRIRQQMVRNQYATKGIWTIETGESLRKLHINAITGEIINQDLDGATIYTEPIRTSVRAVAAYMSKRSGAPEEQEYKGRLFGSWGQIGQWMENERIAPVVQAATLNDLITTPYNRGSSAPTRCLPDSHFENKATTREEFAEIAKKHLSALYDAVNKQRARQ